MYIQSLQPTTINTTSYLNIVAEKMEKLTIKVVDVQGMIAKKLTTQVTQGIQELDINLNDLANGNYILNAFSKDGFLKSFRFKKL